jgi:hypothetical protein
MLPCSNQMAALRSDRALHVVRTDLDPVRQVMSEYANGRFGWFMTAAFYAMGLACVAHRVDDVATGIGEGVDDAAPLVRWCADTAL